MSTVYAFRNESCGHAGEKMTTESWAYHTKEPKYPESGRPCPFGSSQGYHLVSKDEDAVVMDYAAGCIDGTFKVNMFAGLDFRF